MFTAEKEFCVSTAQVCMFLSLDRTDISYAAEESARCYDSPTKGHMASLRHIAGYIKETLKDDIGICLDTGVQKD